jgi:hypothetical protein
MSDKYYELYQQCLLERKELKSQLAKVVEENVKLKGTVQLEDRLWKAIEILDFYANGNWDIGKPARDFLATNNKENL